MSFTRKMYAGKGGIKEMLVIALPMVASFACDVVMQFTDRIFLSRLAPEAMNAALGGGTTALVLSYFFVGLISFSTGLVAQYFGAKQKNNSAKVLTQAVWLALVAYPVILIIKPLGISLFKIMQLTDEQFFYQKQYYNILVLGSIFTLVRTAFVCFFSGIGRTRIVMQASIVTMLVNVGVNYVLIFGKLGFPEMGISGAATGTIIATIIGVVVLAVKYLGRKNKLDFDIKHSFRFDRAITRKLFYFGTPQGVEMFVNMLAFNLLIFIFQSQGNVISTAITITFNWDYISFFPLIGIEVAITSLVGKYMGAGKVKLAVKSAFSGLTAGIIYSFVCFLFFVFMPEILVRVFKTAGESGVFEQAIPLAKRMVQLAALYVMFDAVMVCFIGALRGAGDTHWTMWASIATHWIMVITAYLMFNVFKFDVVSVWLSVVVIVIIFAFALFVRFRRGRWKNIRMIDEIAAP